MKEKDLKFLIGNVDEYSNCKTPCPNKPKRRIGSVACQGCEHCASIRQEYDDIIVGCSYHFDHTKPAPPQEWNIGGKVLKIPASLAKKITTDDISEVAALNGIEIKFDLIKK